MDQLKEQDAVEMFWKISNDNIKKAWPETYSSLKDLFKKAYPFEINEPDEAQSYLLLASIALEFRALQNLFPERYASIRSKAINFLKKIDPKDIFANKLNLYELKVKESFEQYARNPHYGLLEKLAIQLLQDWFGDKVSIFYLKGTTIINPLVTAPTGSIVPLISGGFWKKIKDNFIIIDD